MARKISRSRIGSDFYRRYVLIRYAYILFYKVFLKLRKARSSTEVGLSLSWILVEGLIKSRPRGPDTEII